MNKEIIGVILAAGKGTRLRPLNITYPKALIPVCNKTIMQYQVELMKSQGIKKIIIVVGHLKKQIADCFGDGKKFNVQITYVEQEETLGIAHAVSRLEEYIKTPFLLFLGDIFFLPKDFSHMIDIFRRNKSSAVLAVKKEFDVNAIKRNFAVLLKSDKSSLVKQVVEKPRYIFNKLKGCGIYLFDLSIFDAIRQTPRTAMRDEYEITTSIQMLINEGYRVRIAEVVAWDNNITFASDILQCNLKQLSLLSIKNCISKSAKINPEAKLFNSVIGDNVEIKYPIKIVNSVIFNDVKVKTRKDLMNWIITPKININCPEDCGQGKNNEIISGKENRTDA